MPLAKTLALARQTYRDLFGQLQFGYGLNYLIDTENAVIVDVATGQNL